MKPPRVPEKAVQPQVVQLLKSIGGRVWVLGTRRSRFARCDNCGAAVVLKGKRHHSTRQTPGVADVLAFMPPRPPRERWLLLFVEAKAAGGRLRDEQALFRELCLGADVAHVVGDLDAVIGWCVERGYLKRENVPWYRFPKGESGGNESGLSDDSGR